jgi:hypothetical protein
VATEAVINNPLNFFIIPIVVREAAFGHLIIRLSDLPEEKT